MKALTHVSKSGNKIHARKSKGIKKINQAWTDEDMIEPIEAKVTSEAVRPNKQL